MKYSVFIIILLGLAACSSIEGGLQSSSRPAYGGIWRGVDLSYVNELEDCGAIFSDAEGRSDPYVIMQAAGANIVRLRLWHTPDWTEYGTLADVKKSIARAHNLGMEVLLDFHYSDDWAHPGKQLIPKAWEDHDSEEALAQMLYDYTYETLSALHQAQLLPRYVQVGNETNTDMLITEIVTEDAPISWERNVKFLNAGIKAIRDFTQHTEQPIDIMLHIAQPENVEGWFDDAMVAGLLDFDMIGLSFYAKWSKMPFKLMDHAIARFVTKYQKPVVVVETAYPWTLKSNDEAHNLLGEDSLIAGYSPTKGGQRQQLIDLMQTVLDNGGKGVVYWEPAWISPACETRWSKGSHWENAALFDFSGRLHKGADFLAYEYPKKGD